jgi:hypothetical protein
LKLLPAGISPLLTLLVLDAGMTAVAEAAQGTVDARTCTCVLMVVLVDTRLARASGMACAANAEELLSLYLHQAAQRNRISQFQEIILSFLSKWWVQHHYTTRTACCAWSL